MSLPSNSAGVDEEQEATQLDEATRTATAASSSSGVLDGMLRDPSPRSLESLRIKRLSPRRYACLFMYRHALTEAAVSTVCFYSPCYIEGPITSVRVICPRITRAVGDMAELK